MTDTHLCVAIYLSHTQADEAISRLQFAGCGMKHLSIAGHDTWANAVGSYTTGDQSKYCGPLGLFWGKLWSLLRGRGVFCFDENGPVLIAGPLVRTIVYAQERDPIDGNGFESGLSILGIPGESLEHYAKALMNNQILLFVSGALEEVNRTRDILNETKAINHTLHHGAGDHLSLKITGNPRRSAGGD
jgi:hypothetical protein